MEFTISDARPLELEEHVKALRDLCSELGLPTPAVARPSVVAALQRHMERRAIAFTVLRPDMVPWEGSRQGDTFGVISAYVDPWLRDVATAAEGGGFSMQDRTLDMDVRALFARYPPSSPMGARMKAEQFALLPQQTFLNAGSYGATPRVVLDARLEWEACEMVGPWAWRVSTLPLRLRQVQNRLAEFVGAHPADLQLMVNANAGTSTILKSLPWEAGDVLLLFSCDYDATKLAARWLEATYGVQTEYIDATLPMTDDAIVRALTTFLQVRRTQKQPMPRLFNFCHCTSRTGWIFPAKRLTDAAHEFGVTVMIDGAQVPGHFPLDISHIAPEYYVGTCHKWMMTPPGVGFVVVAPSKQRVVRPLAAATPHEDAFARAFAASAPQDATPFLAVLQAFEFVDRVCGGWRSVWEYNATLARQAVRELTRMWNLEAERLECLQSAQVFHNGRPGVDAVNCLPVVPLPRGRGATAGDATRLMGYLLTRKETTAFLIVERIRCPDGTVCPVLCVRLTCQVHVSLDDVRRLGRAVAELQGTYKVGVDGAPDGEGDPVSMDYDANSFHVA